MQYSQPYMLLNHRLGILASMVRSSKKQSCVYQHLANCLQREMKLPPISDSDVGGEFFLDIYIQLF